MTSNGIVAIVISFIRAKGRYFSLLYFGFLAIACFLLLFIELDNIPVLLTAPLVYSLVVSTLLLISAPLFYVIAYHFKKIQKLKERAVKTAGGIVFILGLFLGISLRAESPRVVDPLINLIVHYDMSSTDIVFLMISLLEITIVVLYTSRWGLGEIEFISSLIDQIAKIGGAGLVLWMGAVLVGVIATKFAEPFYPDQTRIILVFLLAYYLMMLYERSWVLMVEKRSVSKEYSGDRISSRKN